MSTSAFALPPALATLRTRAKARWRSFAPRERLALGVGGALLAVFIAWSAFIAPAWRTLQAAPAELDQLDSQLQQLQRLAADAKTLQGAPPMPAAEAVAPLKAATDRLGGKGAIVFQGDRATLTLTGVSGDALRDWLREARSGARARATDVQLNRDGDGYSGVVVVSLGAGA
jgi:general secretion pathway protein M